MFKFFFFCLTILYTTVRSNINANYVINNVLESSNFYVYREQFLERILIFTTNLRDQNLFHNNFTILRTSVTLSYDFRIIYNFL